MVDCVIRCWWCVTEISKQDKNKNTYFDMWIFWFGIIDTAFKNSNRIFK